MGDRNLSEIATLVEEALALGASFVVLGESVKVSAPAELPSDLVQKLRERKVALIAYLDTDFEPWALREWRRVSTPQWRQVLAESVGTGDSKRELYARWMPSEVLLCEISSAQLEDMALSHAHEIGATRPDSEIHRNLRLKKEKAGKAGLSRFNHSIRRLHCRGFVGVVLAGGFGFLGFLHQHGLAREFDAARVVDVDDLDPHHVAHLHHVGHVLHESVGELGDVAHAVRAGRRKIQKNDRDRTRERTVINRLSRALSST